MKEVIQAPNSGFCFGVKKAIETAEDAAKGGSDINTCGMLIHNSRVVEDLKSKGIGIINNIEEAVDESTVIVRSHGEPKKFYDMADKKRIHIIDATCPFVARIHDIVKNAYDSGKKVLIVGNKEHPEIIGINGWCENDAIIVNDRKELEDIAAAGELDNSLINSVVTVAQTTIRKEVYEDVIEYLKCLGIEPEVNQTICSATRERQEGCRNTAENVECMIVIGDKKSSNTKKLFEIAKKHCAKAYFVEKLTDLPLKELGKYNRIGVAAGASTPASAIKEVISSMSDRITEDGLTMADFMDEIEQSLRLPRGGELVTGKIHQVTDKEIIVNLGCKKDGIIPLDEISLEGDQKLTDLFSEGDEIQAKVLKTDDGDGTILLSKKKLEASEHWEEITRALEEKTLIDVEVIRKVNGGVIAAYKEVQGFIPLSQLSDRFVEDASEFVGQTLTVRVTRVDPRRNKAVFSHKAFLNEERQKALEKVWANIHVGDIVEGTVMRFTDYGAFVDIGGIDGLLHISEISWGKLKHPKEVLEDGQKISVKILSMNAEKGKISLGLKQTTPEPWSVIDENYSVGQIVKGKVVQIKEYGCFVELEPGLDGLVHISEIKNERVADINDELKTGQEVNAKILEIDKERKRISLSIKEAGALESEVVTEENDSEEVTPEEAVCTQEACPVQEPANDDVAVDESTTEEVE